MKKLFLITGLSIISSVLFAQANTLDVKGTAIIDEKPSLIDVAINVDAKSSSYVDCQNKLLAIIEKEKQIFTDNQIDKDLFKINQLRVSENTEYKNGTVIRNGYVGSAVISVENDYSTDFVNKLLAALKSDSLSLTFSIDFALSEKQKAELRETALKLAVTDAKEKAKIIADASNVGILSIKHIQFTDESNYGGFDVVRRKDVTGFVGNAHTNTTLDFNPQDISIEKSVIITWTIADKKNK
jgi:uncharacterized protein